MLLIRSAFKRNNLGIRYAYEQTLIIDQRQPINDHHSLHQIPRHIQMDTRTPSYLLL